MEFPVRCFTCGAVIAQHYEKYRELLKDKGPEAALDELGLDRFCCRRMFLAHVDLVDRVLKYPRT
ncbi:DNA-directed RNA polymerase subunit N [Candidatus Micrarchaeota archaeon]|nr:DNA-directed RNA polymerase subunit N [Candidatus Micrarchaeota archaeon]